MTRFKAFAIHFGISAMIFLVILYLIVFHWYPLPFFNTDGGWQGIRIIAAVDLVLGPLLTLIVFKQGKSGLKFDLTLIGLAQLGALSWGIWAVYNERPIAAVYADGLFGTVTAYQVNKFGMSSKQLREFGNKPPYWIYSDLPPEIDELQTVRLRALQTGTPIYLFTEFYRPMNEEILSKIRKMTLKFPDTLKGDELIEYQSFIKDYPDENLVFFPWHSRYSRSVIALNAKNGAYVGNLAIFPPTVYKEE